MVKISKFAQATAVTAVVAATVFVPASVSADATNKVFVPNTTACGIQVSAPRTANGGVFTVTKLPGASYRIDVTTAPTKDVTVFASSYSLTSSDYVGGCFHATGATPQQYDGNTQTITIPKGSTKSITINIPLNADACNNEQTDVYFGNKLGEPLNHEVTNVGHRYYGGIIGNILLGSEVPACNVKPGVVKDDTFTPPAPAPAPAVVAGPAATLSDTGLNVQATSILAAVLLATTSFVFMRRSKTQE